MSATTLTMTPVGEYYLRLTETACGFRINEDHTFQFFFSQGALDRFGEGTWQMKGDQIVLNSRKRPAQDFALLQSKKDDREGVRIQITDSNDLVIRYVQATIRGGYVIQQEVANDSGLIQFGSQKIDSIELAFAFCPEKVSVFTVESKDHNFFEFRFEPWMMEFFFQDFVLTVKEDGMEGANPVLNGDSFNYEKN
jgi:hypothetical protein